MSIGLGGFRHPSSNNKKATNNMLDNYVTREEFRAEIIEFKSDFKDILKAQTDPINDKIGTLVDHVNTQNGRVGDLEEWQIVQNTERKGLNVVAASLWSAGGTGVLMWVIMHFMR